MTCGRETIGPSPRHVPPVQPLLVRSRCERDRARTAEWRGGWRVGGPQDALGTRTTATGSASPPCQMDGGDGKGPSRIWWPRSRCSSGPVRVGHRSLGTQRSGRCRPFIRARCALLLGRSPGLIRLRPARAYCARKAPLPPQIWTTRATVRIIAQTPCGPARPEIDRYWRRPPIPPIWSTPPPAESVKPLRLGGHLHAHHNAGANARPKRASLRVVHLR